MTRSRTAVVSGGTGFLGRHLCRRLLAEGWSVVAAVRTESSSHRLPEGCDPLIISPNIPEFVNSIRSVDPRVIFHLAARGGAAHTTEDIDSLIEANITLGCALLESCVGTSSRFVAVGSYWQHSRPDETPHPNSLYAALKQSLEDISRYYCEIESVPVIVLKPYDIYGPDDRRGRLLNALAEAAVSGVELATTAGEQIVSFVHVDDVVAAIMTAATLPEIEGEHLTYGVPGPETGPLRSTIEDMAAELGIDIPVSWGARPYRRNEVMQPAALETVPHWEPTIRLPAGFRELLSDVKDRK